MLIDEETDDARKVRSTYGVSDIVRTGNRLGSVPDTFINEVRATLADNKNGSINSLAIGQKVEIVKGPFSGLIAELIQFNSETRVKCLFDLISGKVSASVLMGDLIGIDKEEKTSNFV